MKKCALSLRIVNKSRHSHSHGSRSGIENKQTVKYGVNVKSDRRRKTDVSSSTTFWTVQVTNMCIWTTCKLYIDKLCSTLRSYHYLTSWSCHQTWLVVTGRVKWLTSVSLNMTMTIVLRDTRIAYAISPFMSRWGLGGCLNMDFLTFIKL